MMTYFAASPLTVPATSTPLIVPALPLTTQFSSSSIPAPLRSLTLTTVLEYVLLGVAIIWLVYTCVLAYHWFHYGHKSRAAGTVIAVHILVSAGLFLFALTSLY